MLISTIRVHCQFKSYRGWIHTAKMNSFTLLLTIALLSFQIQHYECFDKKSAVLNAVSSNLLESHVNSKEIALADYLEPENSLSIPETSNMAKSRRKRYLAFPEGATFSVYSFVYFFFLQLRYNWNTFFSHSHSFHRILQVAFCETVGFVGNPQFIYLSWALNWGLAYDLPNDTWVNEQKNRKMHPKPLVQRRHRRDLFHRLEVAIERYEIDVK